MFNERQASILERREDIMLVLIAMMVPVVTMSSMLGF
jgi:hypothetical protein